MQIDSARELKAKLAPGFITSVPKAGISALSVGRTAPGAINLSAQSLKSVESVQRSVAVGISKHGPKAGDYKIAVRVQRRALATDYIAHVHQQAKGEVDVRYVGRIAKRATPWYQQRNRPIRPGCSIGHFAITAGTLGCFVKDAKGKLYILSNNHVLANENKAKAGDAILQPGAYDGGKNPADRVGALKRFIKLSASGANFIDCAIASIAAGIQHDPALKGIGAVAGLFAGDIRDGITVQKVGRTTGVTKGQITAFELDNVVINYDLGNLRFDNQIEIEGATSSFSDGGDSGSLIVDDNLMGLALLFAGSDQGGSNGFGLTYANPLDTVLKGLKVSLA